MRLHVRHVASSSAEKLAFLDPRSNIIVVCRNYRTRPATFDIQRYQRWAEETILYDTSHRRCFRYHDSTYRITSHYATYAVLFETQVTETRYQVIYARLAKPLPIYSLYCQTYLRILFQRVPYQNKYVPRSPPNPNEALNRSRRFSSIIFSSFFQNLVDGAHLLLECCKLIRPICRILNPGPVRQNVSSTILRLTYLFQWFSLLYPNNTLFMNSFRECYEAYVIYSFMRFLFNYLHERYENLDDTISQKRQIPHFFPFWFLNEWKMGKQVELASPSSSLKSK